MSEKPYPPESLSAFLQYAPENLTGAMKILGAAVALTNDLARFMVNKFVPDLNSEEVIACLRICDFVIWR